MCLKPEALNLLYALNSFEYRDDIKIIGACKNDDSIENITNFRNLHEADYSFSDKNNLGSKFNLFKSAFIVVDEEHKLRSTLGYGVKTPQILQLLEEAKILSQEDIIVEDFQSNFIIESEKEIALDDIFSSEFDIAYSITKISNTNAVTSQIVDNTLIIKPETPQRESFVTVKAQIDEERSISKTFNILNGLGCTVESFEQGDFSSSSFNFSTTEEFPWNVNNTSSLFGDFSAMTPINITQGETSILSTEVEILGTENRNFEFYFRVSGVESGNGELKLFLDDEFIMYWSKSVSWEKFSLPLTPGNHNIELRFYKTTREETDMFAQIDGITLNQNSTSIDELLPQKFNIRSYPNPFNPSTNIVFNINRSEEISVNLLNVSGQLVKSIKLNAKRGENNFHLNMNGFNSGVYILHMKDKQNRVLGSKKLTLIK
ncbi:MAG: hypothetical protein CR982_01220 [Candidatus Cloacimonadota bacterium]|nr:MAG: hypothetical protein CR982_01220 [Candidatus Cloacimonadota bacterium]PIE81265.1 MAG: hypothetical protein CSA15_01000 [Candidatus Delongbacteria bacterium]